jgi:DNA-binding XRE family transcriptional regulator
MARRADAPSSKTSPSAKHKQPAQKVVPAAPKYKFKTKPPAGKATSGGRVEKRAPSSDAPVADDYQAIFGHNLKAARMKNSLKQSEVAERTGLTQQRLSQIENGHQNITLKTMVKLAQVVGHDISVLLTKVKADR